MIEAVDKFIRDENGATAIEYALIASFISIVMVASLTLIGTKLSAKFQAVGNGLN